MNPQDWDRIERANSCIKVQYVRDLINENFRGAEVNFGIIYLSIGGNGGRSPTRFLLFMPSYGPNTQLNIRNQFIFAWTFQCMISVEFYGWLDKAWTNQITTAFGSNKLFKCSPVLICLFDSVDNAEFRVVDWIKSTVSQNTVVARSGLLECWIQCPMENLRGETASPTESITDCRGEFMRFLQAGDVNQLAYLLEPLLTTFHHLSFPSIQMQITSPMVGLVPFPVRPISVKIGGNFTDADREERMQYVPVANISAEHCKRHHHFQRIWNILSYPVAGDESKATANTRKSVFKKLDM